MLVIISISVGAIIVLTVIIIMFTCIFVYTYNLICIFIRGGDNFRIASKVGAEFIGDCDCKIDYLKNDAPSTACDSAVCDWKRLRLHCARVCDSCEVSVVHDDVTLRFAIDAALGMFAGSTQPEHA